MRHPQIGLLPKTRIYNLRAPFVAFGSLFSCVRPDCLCVCAREQAQKGQWNWEALTCGACAAIQVCVIIYSSTPTATEPPQILWLLWRLTELPFQLSLWPLGALLLLASTVWHGDDKWFRAAILIGVLSLTLIIAFKFNHQPSIFVSGTVAQRYWYVQSVLWLLIAASALRERSLLFENCRRCRPDSDDVVLAIRTEKPGVAMGYGRLASVHHARARRGGDVQVRP